MSNLAEAIDLLEDAEELVSLEAETDELNSNALLAIVDQIRQVKHDLEGLSED